MTGLSTGLRASIFWRVALLLVGVLLAVGLGSVVLSAWLALSQSRSLVANSLRLRLNELAEEVELRADSMDYGILSLPSTLVQDMAARFPDPLYVLDANGIVIRTIWPDPIVFPGADSSTRSQDPPNDLGLLLESGDIAIRLSREDGGTWGAAPLYDPAGLLVGGLLVKPLDASSTAEYAGVRGAYFRAMILVAILALLVAIVAGGLLTYRLVRPIRTITRQVERIGAGDYDRRIRRDRPDELGRLAGAVNRMAGRVKASIDDLRAADTLRRELIANVGHDLRTPLAALKGYLEEASHRLERGEDDRARSALETAERQGDYVTRLVEELFELSVLESGHSPVRREPVPVGELLTECVRSHDVAYRKAGVDLRPHIPKGLPVIHGDGVRLLRLFDNLLTNAVNHTPAGGQVSISAERKASGREGVVVTITDSGAGMTPEQTAHLFERYYRGSDARTRSASGGTGLGLSIAQAVARAHGGEIEVRSAPGKGSAFTVTLAPVPELESPAESPSETALRSELDRSQRAGDTDVSSAE